ncbi:helix-turn-helix domain-containing protein [Streptantibioticus silvisoli]|uniref:helix-turn-helix domain-containing protein n=1 Tax=Streptantibioticus silvisoli TaxID=2705255 RepID=UPI003F6B60E3
MSIGNSSSDAPSSASDVPSSTPSIGLILARGRRDAGLTVDAVSAATRVRVPLVRAIELDDFGPCGGDVYARGHIRAYARAVGIDPDPLVDRYDAEHGGRPEPTPVAPMYDTDRVRVEPRRPNWTAAMIAAIVVVVAFVGFTMFSGGGSQQVAGHASQQGPSSRPSASAPSAAPSAPGSTAPSAPSTLPSTQPSNSPIAAVPANKVVVKLTAGGGKSWVSATGANGNTLFQGLLGQGQSKTFTDDKKISLVLGNAGAVQLFVNGKDLGTAGGNGQLVRTDFTPGNPQAG